MFVTFLQKVIPSKLVENNLVTKKSVSCISSKNFYMTDGTNRKETWWAFITTHVDQKELLKSPISIPASFDQAKEIAENFKILTSSPSSVLSTYNSISDEIISTFYHSTLGNKHFADNKK